MRYVALPQRTCAWLLTHKGIASALATTLLEEDLRPLRSGELAHGPLRMVGSADGRLLAIWNREHLTGTGSEEWAVFRLESPCGLLDRPEIGHQVFERTIYVANQRLLGLVIDSELIHRAQPNGTHTCLAGRGSEARKYSIGYIEMGGTGSSGARAIMVLGPQHDFGDLTKAVADEASGLNKLLVLANSLTEGTRRRPLVDAPAFQTIRSALSPSNADSSSLQDVSVATQYAPAADGVSPYETIHWSYDQWVESGQLNEVQRRVLEADSLTRHPVRIIGPAGSGKTLLMQLLALRYLRAAQADERPTKILYVVHNAPMASAVVDRLRALGAEEYLTSGTYSLQVTTLAEYGRNMIGVSESSVIDKDAHKTKMFQFDQIREALADTAVKRTDLTETSKFISEIVANETLRTVFAALIMAEISTVIKGRGLVGDEKRYIAAEAPFSRLHGIMTANERRFVFEVFKKYHEVVFEGFEMLDSDDVALSLSGRLRTPLWELRRKMEGFDFIFVDEAQLFNENERRVFAYLGKGTTAHVPIVLALDEAQEPFGFSTAGLATLGIEDIESETLPSNHRSTKEVVALAFFVIQRTTDLFGADFPDFASSGADASARASGLKPALVKCNEEAKSFSRFVLKAVQKLRAKNVRQIAVICHADRYWDSIRTELEASQLPLHVISQRGEKLSPDQPLVVLSRPAFVGGQEFDAVIIVGLEQGVTPPRVTDNPPLSAALEQQTLREMYLAISRAKNRVVVVLNRDATPNSIIADALQKGLIIEGDTDD
ncbi:3'-5' exonuclease [Brevundimonas sp. LjRoot202]|uniref:3'-5' exonuclease n=1 Tax=Brevundimonas sp. LjRoot202 TaxID=3342281 RepID=UPI003ED114AF